MLQDELFTVYILTTKPEVRVKIMLDAMLELDKLDFAQCQKVNDLITISVATLPKFARLLEQWVATTQDDSKPQLLLTMESYNEKILMWCLTEAEARTTAIVVGKYREAYERAALLATLQLRDATMATRFLAKIKNNFPTHTAFQSALRAAQDQKAVYVLA